jgi:hypothetical protein
LKHSASGPDIVGMTHPAFEAFAVSWELTLLADGFCGQHRQGVPERRAESGRLAG